MLSYLEPNWRQILEEEFEKQYFETLETFVEESYKNTVCFPSKLLIFNALNKCEFKDIKVVIIGQDPYHKAGQANGLSFSVADGIKFPQSLRNIFKELKNDLELDIPFSGNLEPWATQGVLLLNSILTVENGKPGSHKNKGWEIFTDAIVDIINVKHENIVFLLWGAYAHKKGFKINRAKHLVIESKHPSPLSANFGGWFNQNNFSNANNYLNSKNKTPIDWQL